MANGELQTLIDRNKTNILNILGGNPKRYERFMALAWNAIMKDPKARACTPQSQMQCILDAATCELELGTPDHLAYLIPYVATLTFSPGYVGMMKRLKECGAVMSIRAELVCEKDKVFEYISGKPPKHKWGKLNERGPVVAAYAAAVLTNGIVEVEILELRDIAAIKRSAMKTGHGISPAWREYEGEMVKKAAIRRLAKKLIGDVSGQGLKSEQIDKLRAVLDADNKQFDLSQNAATNGAVDMQHTTLDDIADEIPANEPVRKVQPVPDPPPPPAEPEVAEPEPEPEPVYLSREEQRIIQQTIVAAGWLVDELPDVIELVAGKDIRSAAQILHDDLPKVMAALKQVAKDRAETEAKKKEQPKRAGNPQKRT